jgi:epsilon-lactone hydrolase
LFILINGLGRERYRRVSRAAFSHFASDDRRTRAAKPGAVGTFCASLVEAWGDSAFVGPVLSGQAPVVRPLLLVDLPYFKGIDPHDPLVFPGVSATVLANFPPTLLISGSRDFALSSVLRSHALLVQAGVDAELHVYEGMWHSLFSDPELPESRAAYDVMVRFFDRHLGR